MFTFTKHFLSKNDAARNAELTERVAKLKEKQLENVVIKNLLYASCVSTFGQVSQKT
jgi:hypothetical protein